jgi:hypothetical protein
LTRAKKRFSRAVTSLQSCLLTAFTSSRGADLLKKRIRVRVRMRTSAIIKISRTSDIQNLQQFSLSPGRGCSVVCRFSSFYRSPERTTFQLQRSVSSRVISSLPNQILHFFVDCLPLKKSITSGNVFRKRVMWMYVCSHTYFEYPCSWLTRFSQRTNSQHVTRQDY